MKTFIIRIDDSLYREIKKRSKLNSTSMNKFILSLIEEDFGLAGGVKKPKRYTDLDALSGKWAREDYSLILKNINEQRKIERELWK